MKGVFFILLVLLFPFSKALAQGSLYARTNLQLATNASAYWVGPQAGVGIGIQWPSGFGIITEYYSFRDKVDESGYEWYDNRWFTWHEKGSIRQKTLTFMGSYTFGKSKERGMYAMAGIAYQARNVELETEYGDCPGNRNYFTPAFEFGHRWPVSKSGYGIAASMKFTGPISYNSEPHIEYIDLPESGSQYPSYVGESSTLEILTQLSIGIVVDRVFPLKKKK
jgi:hypothetical protein